MLFHLKHSLHIALTLPQSPISLHRGHILRRFSNTLRCLTLNDFRLPNSLASHSRFPWHSAEQANLWPALTFHAGRSTSLPHSEHTPIAYFGLLFDLALPAYVQAFEQKRTEAAFRSNSDPQCSQLCKRFLRVIARRHSLPQVACRLTGLPQFKHSLLIVTFLLSHQPTSCPPQTQRQTLLLVTLLCTPSSLQLLCCSLAHLLICFRHCPCRSPLATIVVSHGHERRRYH